MKQKTLIRIHIITTAIALTTISSFFSFSLIAEIIGENLFIKKVKTGILYCLPILVFTMPLLGITGKKLAKKSKSNIITKKMARMKLIVINGILLIFIAIYLYYKAIYDYIDDTFFYFQILELVLGLFNLILIGLNIKSGRKLSKKVINLTSK